MMKGDTLRWQVEDILRADQDHYSRIPAEDVQSLMRQLQIQQIALELENKELRELHSRLREKRDHYRRLFERIPNCCIVLDADQTVRAANEPATSVLNQDQSRLIGTNWRDLIHPDDRAEWDFQLERSEKSAAEELNIRIAVDGQLISDRWWCCPTRNDNGQLESVLLVLPVGQLGPPESDDSVVSEVSHESDAKSNSLHTAEECYRVLTEFSAEAVVGVTLDGTIQTWNRAAQAMLGTDAETAIGTSILQFARFLGWVEAKQLYSTVRREGSITDQRMRLQLEDSRMLDVVLNSQPVHDAAGRGTGALIIIRDVTRANATNSELIHGGSDAQETSRLRSMGKLIAILAHELSQPLTVMTGCAVTCADRLESESLTQPDLDDAIRRINDQAERAGTIIRNLRRLVTKSANSGTAIDLHLEIREACRFIEHEVAAHKATIVLNTDDALPMVQADALQLQEVLVNLLQNSLRTTSGAMAEDCRIVVGTELLPDAVRISIRNSGNGITSDTPGLLAEPRLSTAGGSLEAELTSCERIIRAHNGVLNTVHNPDATTTFEITLPRQGM